MQSYSDQKGIMLVKEMTLAAKEGLKTHTRRIVKTDQYKPDLLNTAGYYATGKVLTSLDNQPGAFMEFRNVLQDDPRYTGSPASYLVECPYGKPGNVLYVKEGYKIDKHSCAITEDGPTSKNRIHGHYTADNAAFDVALTPHEWEKFKARKYPYRKTPGRFMYKSLSRMELHITDIRVERIQDITPEDAQKEGVTVPEALKLLAGYYPGSADKVAFISLWDKINALRGYSWKSNPYVWVIVFEVWLRDPKNHAKYTKIKGAHNG